MRKRVESMYVGRFALSALLGLALIITGCVDEKFIGTDISATSEGKDFTLTDHHGQHRSLADFRGKLVVISFGYLHCPDICPTTLAEQAEALRQLGDDAAKVQIVFVSVDPARDTPDTLRAYVSAFHPSMLGLYGDDATTAATAKRFGVFYQHQPGATAQTYTVDHSTGSYVADRHGRVRLYLAHGKGSAALAHDLKLLFRQG